jgi:hypothetical protein
VEEALGIVQSLQGRGSLAQLHEDLDAHHAMWASNKDSEEAHVTRLRGEVILRIVRAMDAGERTGATATTTSPSANLMLSDAEIDSLISSIEGVRGVRVHPVLVRDCIVEHGRSIVGLVQVVKHLLVDDSSSEMFRVVPNP